MNAILRMILAVAGLAFATHAAAQVTFYEREDFGGRSFTTQEPVGNLDRFGFNDRASSVIVANGPWKVCEDARFRGQCVVLRPGRYPSLAAMGLNDRISSVRALNRNERIDDSRDAPAPGGAQITSQITFYEREGFAGQTFTTDRPIRNCWSRYACRRNARGAGR